MSPRNTARYSHYIFRNAEQEVSIKCMLSGDGDDVDEAAGLGIVLLTFLNESAILYPISPRKRLAVK